MADDILNIEGKPEMLGKPVGSDQALQKVTGPSMIGLEQAKARASDLVEHALEDWYKGRTSCCPGTLCY
jgi:geranylgeranyl pyrophosphate synthase